MATPIQNIKSAIASCDVVATIMAKSDVRTFAGNNSYINLELFDEDNIKLTLFGDALVKKVQNMEVSIEMPFRFMVLRCIHRPVSIRKNIRVFSLNHAFQSFDTSQENALLSVCKVCIFPCIWREQTAFCCVAVGFILYFFLLFQVGDTCRFHGCRASQAKANFAHLCKNKYQMELFGGTDFSVVKILDEIVMSTMERASINAKSNKVDAPKLYECPKTGCAGNMEKISDGDYKCEQCVCSYTTFKWREPEVPGIEDDKSSQKETESETDGSKPKRRCLRNRNNNK